MSVAACPFFGEDRSARRIVSRSIHSTFSRIRIDGIPVNRRGLGGAPRRIPRVPLENSDKQYSTPKPLANMATSGRAFFSSRPLLAGIAGGLAAPLPAVVRRARRDDQTRVGVVVLRAAIRAAIRFCRRAHAGTDPIVPR